jgi:hypothetical protein
VSATRDPTRPPPPNDPGDGGDGCCWGGRHLPVIVYSRRPRDLFRRRFWLLCWACDFQRGPFEIIAMAELERDIIER